MSFPGPTNTHSSSFTRSAPTRLNDNDDDDRGDVSTRRFRPVSHSSQYESRAPAPARSQAQTTLPSLSALVPEQHSSSRLPTPEQQFQPIAPPAPLKSGKPPLPVDLYPTPPPSPDLIELPVVPDQSNLVHPVSPPVQISTHTAFVPNDESDIRCLRHGREYSLTQNVGNSDAPLADYNYNSQSLARHSSPTQSGLHCTPAIPISSLLNSNTTSNPTTPHSLPQHAAPFKLAHPAGILSVLGGYRVLQVDSASSVLDRMPYSAASTNGNAKGKANNNSLALTQDQGEEASVEALLNGDGDQHEETAQPAKSTLRLPPMSPDQARMSTIMVQPPTPDRDDPRVECVRSTAGWASPCGSRSASPRASPAASPMGSPNQSVRVSSSTSSASNSTPMLPLGLQTLPEVRSPPRKTVEMSPEPIRASSRSRRRRRPKMFGFTEVGGDDYDGEDGNSSGYSSRESSPERGREPEQEQVHEVGSTVAAAAADAVAQNQTEVASSSMGPASSSPGNFIPRRQTYVRAKSDTNLHESRHSESSSPSSSSYLAPSRPKPQSMLSPPDRHANGQVTMTTGRRGAGLKLDFTGIVPLTQATASSSGPLSAAPPSPYSARLIRKKSGEILKPALKPGGPLAANGTPLEAPPKPDAAVDSRQTSRARFASKSLPATPSCPRFVHFDAQLTYVKYFKAEQMPSVVSRSGSPSGEYTTSEGEEYPFPSTDDEASDAREQKLLQIQLPNFPTSHEPDAELFLESLFLDDDRKSLRGVIQVRNMAFQKWVAVRFTFDWWQTTSEVTATHKDSVKGGTYDRFSFTVKLHDLLAKIEEKTLFLAIRYNTDGKEIWDSNDGQNYQVLFQKKYASSSRLVPKRQQPTIQPGMGKAIGGRTSQWSVTTGHDDDRLADLRAKLNRLQADDPTLSPPLSPASSRHNSFSPQRPKHLSLGPSSGSPRRSVSALDARGNGYGNSGDLPAAGGALAARYDFGAALKKERRNSNSPPTPGNNPLPEVRTGLLQFAQNVQPTDHSVGPTPEQLQQQQQMQRGRPTMDFYSPRSEYAKLSPTDGFFAPMQQKQPSPARRSSNSPPLSQSSSSSTVTVTTAPPSFIPVPEVQVQGPSPEPSPNTDEAPSQSSSATVSPPMLESSTGSITDDTPSESPISPPSATMSKWSPVEAKKDLEQGLTDYASFIAKFCWAGDSAAAPEPHFDAPSMLNHGRPAFERRAHSTSSLDNYFSNHGHGHGHDRGHGHGHGHGHGSADYASPGHLTPKGSRPGSGGYFVDTTTTTTPSAAVTPQSAQSTQSIDQRPSSAAFVMPTPARAKDDSELGIKAAPDHIEDKQQEQQAEDCEADENHDPDQEPDQCATPTTAPTSTNGSAIGLDLGAPQPSGVQSPRLIY